MLATVGPPTVSQPLVDQPDPKLEGETLWAGHVQPKHGHVIDERPVEIDAERRRSAESAMNRTRRGGLSRARSSGRTLPPWRLRLHVGATVPRGHRRVPTTS